MTGPKPTAGRICGEALRPAVLISQEKKMALVHPITDTATVHDVLDDLPETREIPWGRKVDIAETIVNALDRLCEDEA